MSVLTNNFGWVSCLLNLVYFLLPIFQYVELIQQKITYKDATCFKLILYEINSILWILKYEITVYLPKQILVNYLTSLIIIPFYIFIFSYSYYNKNIIISLIMTFSLLNIIIQIYFSINFLIESRLAKNIIAMISQIIINIEPIIQIIKVIFTDNYTNIPILTSVYMIIYNYFWWRFANGLRFPDFYASVPSQIGILISLIEIIFWIGYRHKVKGHWYGDDNDNESKNYEYVKKTENVEITKTN